MLRREFLYGVNGGLGALAFHSMLQAEETGGPLVPKVAHYPKAKAKRCIFLYMAGGPSHIDTFDPKPKLKDLHLKKFQRQNKFLSAMGSGERYYVQSPFDFIKAGQSGIEMCDQWEHLSGVADELCVYRGCQAESINHPTANYHMNTGNRFGGDPAIGSWVTYGLGSENQNLPGYVVLPEVAYPQGGAANWSNGYLPPHYQGTTLRAKGSPILDLHPPKGVTREGQRNHLNLLGGLNALHSERHLQHNDLSARMESYELAYRMQMEVPGILDIGKENQSTQEDYGLNNKRTEEFGRRLLLARRLIERGVRFVQVYTAGWDSHDYIKRSHAERIRSVDKPIAALLKDLKERGLLDETLVVWGGEFGRTPDNGKRGGGERLGRDHNKNAMALWMAGGGVNKGSVIGGTDEIGDKAVNVVHPIRDLHVTMLRLMGLDDNKLTYFHGGRFKQLSQTGGEVIDQLIG